MEKVYGQAREFLSAALLYVSAAEMVYVAAAVLVALSEVTIALLLRKAKTDAELSRG